MTNNPTERYHYLLIQEYSEALKGLSPEYSAQENLEWLWGSFSQIENSNLELQSGLCQLALHFGRSALNSPDVENILAASGLETQAKLEQIMAVLQPT